MPENPSGCDLSRARPLLQVAQELRQRAAAARVRADALHAWVRAIHKLVEYRSAAMRGDRHVQPLDANTTREDLLSLPWTVLNAAIAVTEADFGNIQVVDLAPAIFGSSPTADSNDRPRLL